MTDRAGMSDSRSSGVWSLFEPRHGGSWRAATRSEARPRTAAGRAFGNQPARTPEHYGRNTCSACTNTIRALGVPVGRSGLLPGRLAAGGLPVQIVVLGLVRCGELSGPARSRHCRYDFPAALLDKAPTIRRWVAVAGAARATVGASAQTGAVGPAECR